jgi:ubiquinone/menaquinone biosynthesis C-methylase UbiE
VSLGRSDRPQGATERSERETRRVARVYADYEQSGYSERWDGDNAGIAAMQRERASAIEQLLMRNGLLPLGNRRILDVGCGEGDLLAGLLTCGARTDRLQGIDLLPERIAIARERHPDIRFATGNGDSLPFEADAFDIVVLSTVLSSVLDRSVARAIATEALRVLRDDGAILWYDLRLPNPRNRAVRGIRRKDVARLFPDLALDLHSVTVVPPLTRRLGRSTTILYPWLARLPPLRTHWLGLLTKPRPSAS